MSGEPMTPELEALVEGFCKAYDAGYSVAYLEELVEPQRGLLMNWLCREIETDLKKDLH